MGGLPSESLARTRAGIKANILEILFTEREAQAQRATRWAVRWGLGYCTVLVPRTIKIMTSTIYVTSIAVPGQTRTATAVLYLYGSRLASGMTYRTMYNTSYMMCNTVQYCITPVA
jgi:hypothetical protein